MSYLASTQIQQLLTAIRPARVTKKDGMSHVEAYDIRAHLNRIFGFGRWSADVVEMTLVSETFGKNKKGQDAVTVVYRAGLRLTVCAPDGTQLATYTEYAAGDAVNFPVIKRGDAHDFALKTAESQALKRAAINLGDQFGLSLYNNGSTNKLVQVTLVGVEKPTPNFETPTVAPEAQPDVGSPDVAVVNATPEVEAAARDWASEIAAAVDKDALRGLYAEVQNAGLPANVVDALKNTITARAQSLADAA